MSDGLGEQRCAVYARFSCDRQREASIEDQVLRCRQYVEARGGSVDASLVFTDFALSGATMDRPGFEALLKQVQAKQRGVDVVVVEDLSRLTRDFADAGTLFKQLKYAGVRMLGVGDGIDTDGRSAKLMFGVKALISDMYRDDLADKTLRGLKGRVLAGYSAGGLAFGYRTVAETTPDGRAIGSRLEIHEEQATVVKRIFDLYLSGRSLATIAQTLNSESVPPPRAKTKHRRNGWIASSVRAMLHNDRYTGAWTYNQREWIRDPATGKKHPRMREEKDVIRMARPELRIVDPATWQAVQDRLTGVKAYYTRNEDGSPKGRAVPGRKTSYVLSGLLACEECGAPMIVVGTTPKTRAYRCADHLKRRTCTSMAALREGVAKERILAAVIEELQKHATAAYLKERAERRRKELAIEMAGQVRERTKKLDELDKSIANLIAYLMADVKNASAAVTAKLKDLEKEATRERGAIRRAQAANAPVSVPAVDDVLAELRNLEELVASDPIGGREALRAHLRGGRLFVKLDDSTKQIVVRGELIPMGFRDEFPCQNNRVTRVSCSSSGGDVCVDETSEVLVCIRIRLDQLERVAA